MKEYIINLLFLVTFFCGLAYPTAAILEDDVGSSGLRVGAGKNTLPVSSSMREIAHRKLSVRLGCSDNAVAADCSNCNRSGCGVFECSSFTRWTCPENTHRCGYESCVGGFCSYRVWCDP